MTNEEQRIVDYLLTTDPKDWSSYHSAYTLKVHGYYVSLDTFKNTLSVEGYRVEGDINSLVKKIEDYHDNIELSRRREHFSNVCKEIGI